jgi:hypothetical protein
MIAQEYLLSLIAGVKMQSEIPVQLSELELLLRLMQMEQK